MKEQKLKKVNIEDICRLSYDDAEKYLLETGYRHDANTTPADEIGEIEFWDDDFVLDDEDTGEEIDLVTFTVRAKLIEINEDDMNNYEILSAGWHRDE